MEVNDDTLVDAFGLIPEPLVLQLRALAISTIGELLGATQGLQRFPSDDPGWNPVFHNLRAALDADRLRLYQQAPTLPPTGLRGCP